MEKQFLEFVASVMDIDSAEISLELMYKDSEQWDSLMMLTLIMEIEAEYGVSIPMEKIGEIKKLADLYEYIK